MNPTLWDHLFVLLLLVPVPLLGVWQLRRLEALLARGVEDARVRQYRQVIVEEVVFVAAVAGLWLAADRPWSWLAPPAPAASAWAWAWAWVGWSAAAAFSVGLVLQAVVVPRREERLDQVRAQLARVAAFLPRTGRELRTFTALSFAAGIGEEIVFRGFVLAWAAAVAAGLGAGPAAALGLAVVASSVLFGLAHAYQGASGMVRTGVVGLVFAGLAVATGGLVAPMIVHTVVDVTSGWLAYRALGARPASAAGAPAMG